MSPIRKISRNPDYTRWLRALVASLALLTMGQTGVSSGAAVKIRNGKKASSGRLKEDAGDSLEAGQFKKTEPGVRALRANPRRMLRIKGAALQSRMENGEMIVTGLNGGLA